jgi:hypothetical protein
MLRIALVGLTLLVASHSYAQDAPAAPVRVNAPGTQVSAATTAARPTSPPVAPPEPEPCDEYDDYRGFLALSDATALALVITAAAAKETASQALIVSAAGVYALGAPTVHLLNDQPVRAVASLGLRVGLPAALAGISVALSSANCDSSPSTYDGYDGYPDPNPSPASECADRRATAGVLGAGAGMLIAIIADDAFLGKAKVKRDAAPENAGSGAATGSTEGAHPRVRVGLAPLVVPRAQGAGLMAVGTF